MTKIEIGDIKINPIQLFELKPANCGIVIGKEYKSYLIDLDGYIINNKRRHWISTYPPIEFYKGRTYEDGQFIKPSNFIALIHTYQNYYKHGLHLSWMLGILIYIMIQNYIKLRFHRDSNIFTKFNNPIKESDYFTNLDEFFNSLNEIDKADWLRAGISGRSFLEEIKSCLYFDDGTYDDEYLDYSPHPLANRRPFYNDDGSLNLF